MNKQQKIDELNLKISELSTEVHRLEKELWLEKFNNKDYITDLSAYKDQDLVSIRAFGVDGKKVDIPTDGTLVIDNNSKLYASSYDGGIVQWDESVNGYVYWFNYRAKELNIVGFTDIVVG